MSEAIRLYLARLRRRKGISILDVKVWDLGPGTERLSEEIDEILYVLP